MASGKTFIDMKGNVAEIIGDTSDSFKTKIGKWLNARYRDCYRRYQWPQLTATASLAIVAGTQSYDLPDGFSEMIYVYDNVNKVALTLRPIAPDMSDTSLTGAPQYYALGEINPSTFRRVIYLFYTPSVSGTLTIRYKKDYAPMSADSDAPIIDLCDEIERGAEADAWRAKRQFSKSQGVETQYEAMLQARMFQMEQNSDITIETIPYDRGRQVQYGTNERYV